MSSSTGPRPSTIFNRYSFEFDGADDYVDIGYIAELNNASAFTFSGWYKQTTIDQFRPLMEFFVDSSNWFGVYTYTDGNMYIQFQKTNNYYGYFDYSNFLSADTWFNIIIVYNGSGLTNADKLKCYINGTEVILNFVGTIPTTSPSGTNNFKIARADKFNGNWLGKVDEVSVFNSELSASDVTSIYNGGAPNDISSLSPLSWWRMGDEAIYDGNNWLLHDNKPTFSRKSILLDGVDDYVDIGSPSNLNSVTTMSISCWFKTTLATEVLVGADDQSLGRRFILLLNSSKARFLYFNASQSYYFSDGTTSVNDGNWHHVVSVLDGTSIKVYVDGVLEGTANGVGNMNANINTPINIGRRSYASSKLEFQGNIDETSIFNTALTQSEVTSIYNGGVPNDISSLSPLSWWRCGDGDTSPTLTDNGSGGNNGTMTNFSTFSIEAPTLNNGTTTNMTKNSRKLSTTQFDKS